MQESHESEDELHNGDSGDEDSDSLQALMAAAVKKSAKPR